MGGEFDRCLGGVGNLNRKYLVFPVLRNTHVVFSLLAMEEFRGEDCTYQREVQIDLNDEFSVSGRFSRMAKYVVVCFALFNRLSLGGGVGHLNAFLAQGGGHLTKPIFKSSNARGVARGGDVELSH